MAERAAKSSVVQAAAGICLIAAVLFLSLESAESSGKLGTCGGEICATSPKRERLMREPNGLAPALHRHKDDRIGRDLTQALL